MYHLGDGARSLSECPEHGFEARHWVGVGEPTARFVSIFDGYGQMLVLLKLTGQNRQGT